VYCIIIIFWRNINGQVVFRGLSGNILIVIGEEKYNLKINILFNIIHAVINIWALKYFGINGAAVALTIVYFTSGIVMIVHLRNVCRINKYDDEFSNKHLT